ncbi:MEDS domain-containing protein [Halomontanus rarus]|uniref:MEDS domain-containing protein n=1 Tax=Halomontanus rarus TaxID=3034020 RepID=UPI002FF62383
MSHPVKEGPRHDTSGVEHGLEALRRSPAFRGPVEPLDDHEHTTDHLALVYESRDEQFAAAIPYIHQGLERGERCVYITHENSREAVVEAMRDWGIDVDDALESGALSIYDERATYLRTGSFDPEDTLAFLDDAITEAAEEYEALRVTGEMSFILDDDACVDDLVKCESKANYLFEDVDGMALCQYNRKRFPPEVIRDVVNTHPHLIHDNRVSYNSYYEPPSEFLGPDRADREVDRMLGTLREQTDAKAKLEERQRFVGKQTEIIARTDQTFEEKLQALFELSCDRFDLELGALARVDTEDDRFEVEYLSDEHEHFEPGVELPLSETYCTAATEIKAAGSVSDPREEGYDDIHVYREFGVRAYLGTYVEVDGGTDRTFFFVASELRDEDFSDDERAFLQSMGQWVKYELERRNRERELRERTDHLSALVETTPECIKTVADDGTLLQMNSAGLDMVGADSDSDVIGESVYGLIAPEHRETFREFNERICRGESGTLEFDIIGLEGTRRHMETHAAPLRSPDGTVSQIALTRDITEQVEREHDLERALDLLEKTERIADVGGWEIDPETMDVFWTDHLFRLLKVSGDDEPPLEEALDMYHEEDRAIVEDAIEKALDSGDPFDIEVRIRTAGDEVRWLRLQGVPETKTETGTETVGEAVVSLRGAAQDVTERKRREQRLEDVIERLEQFAYAASHDLQEPLRMVSSYLQLLERRYENALDAEGEEFLEFAVNGAERMREMIEGLLAYSRVETQGDPLEPVALEAVFDGVLSDLQIQIEESDAEITVGDLPRVAGDAGQLRQVFQNLLSNAITYSGDEPPRIHVSAERDGSEWNVSVRDEGIGIDPDDQDRIFEVFQRLHTHDEYDGTGIGLAVCERIVERHGGEIRVESEPGEGATFTVTLPAVAHR